MQLTITIESIQELATVFAIIRDDQTAIDKIEALAAKLDAPTAALKAATDDAPAA